MAETTDKQPTLSPTSNTQSDLVSTESTGTACDNVKSHENPISGTTKDEDHRRGTTIDNANSSTSDTSNTENESVATENGNYDYGEDTEIYKAVHGEAQTTTLKRVKVYHLDNENWADMGTGQVHTETFVNADGQFVLRFKVICEDTGNELVSSGTDRCSKYLRQQDTLIVWSEPTDEDLALSFQEKEGCTAVWSAVCKAKGVSPTCEEIGADDDSDDDDDDDDDTSDVAATTTTTVARALRAAEARHETEMAARARVPTLPPVELGKLEEIRDILSKLAAQKQDALTKGDRELRDMVGYQYDTIAERMLADKFVEKAIDLFQQCEDLEDTQSLAHLGGIVSGLFAMCNNSIFELILSNKHILDIIGMFEYLPGEAQGAPIVRHREFLKDTAVFKDVLAIDDTEMIEQIHASYRIRYIRDVILAGVLDDLLQSTLSSYIYFCNVDVYQKLREHPDFLATLMRALRDTTKSPEAYRDGVLFLKDLCTLPRTLPLNMTSSCFLDTLIEKGLLSLYAVWMGMPDKKLRLTALEILSIYVSDKLALVREAIIKDHANSTTNAGSADSADMNGGHASAAPSAEDAAGGAAENSSGSANSNAGVLAVLAKSFVNETDMPFLPQIIAILRSVVDTDNADTLHPTDKTKLLQIFYDDSVIGVLMEPLAWNMKDDYNCTRHEQVYHALGLLAFGIPMHTYFVKNYVMRHSLLQQAMKQVESDKSVLVLAALRLLRVVIGLKNEFYNRHVIKCSLLSPAVAVLRANGPRYNLRYSCVLEMLEFIRKENIKSLVQHLAEVHRADLEAMTYVSTPADLLTRHEQNTEILNMEQNYQPPAGVAGAREVDRHRRDTTMDAEEELYWEDEDTDAAKSKSGAATGDDVTAAHEGTATSSSAAESTSGPPQFRKRLVDYDEDDDDALFNIATKKSRDAP